jgi:hypothetical protein
MHMLMGFFLLVLQQQLSPAVRDAALVRVVRLQQTVSHAASLVGYCTVGAHNACMLT